MSSPNLANLSYSWLYPQLVDCKQEQNNPSTPFLTKEESNYFNKEQLDDELLSLKATIEHEQISWEGRHVTLKPSWYQVKQIAHATGKWFNRSGNGLGGATVISAFALTGGPLTVIAAVGALGALTISAKVTGNVLANKKDFWNDPVYRIEQGQAAAADILKNKLSYKEIVQKYGENIKQYNILTMADINLLLRQDMQQLDYLSFRKKHLIGTNFFSFLDEISKKILSCQFRLSLISSENSLSIPFIELLTTYQEDIQTLELGKQELTPFIQELLGSDLRTLSYDQFRQKHGKGKIIDPSQLNGENQRILSSKLNETCRQLSFALIKQSYADDCNVLGINLSDLEFYCLKRDLNLLTTGKMTYQDFRKNNDVSKLQDLFKDPAWFPALFYVQQAFWGYMANCHKGSIEILEECKEDLNSIRVNPADVYYFILEQETQLMRKKQLDFPTFHQRNGSIQDLHFLEERHPGSIQILTDGATQAANQFDQGLIAFFQQYSTTISSLKLNDALTKIISTHEIKKLEQNQLEYLAFRIRNGLEAIQESLSEANSILRQAFLKMPAHLLLSDQFSQDKVLLNISSHDISLAIGKDIELPYSEFRKKHGLISLRENLLQPKDLAKLKKNFFIHFHACPIQDLENNKEDLQLLQISSEELLKERWKNMSIQQIFKTDKQAFCEHLPSFKAANDWISSKVCEETKDWKIKVLVQEFPELFTLGLLTPLSKQAEKTIHMRFIDEISSVQTLEDLIDDYTLFVINSGLFAKNVPNAQNLVLDYLRRNIRTLLFGDLPDVFNQLNEKRFDSSLFSALLQAREHIQFENREWERTKNKLQENYAKGCEYARQQTVDLIQMAQDRFNRLSLQSQQAEQEKQLSQIESKLSILSKAIDELEKKKKANEINVKVLDREISKLNDILEDPGYFKNREKALQEGLKKSQELLEKSKTATGLTDAISKFWQSSTLEENVKKAEQELKEFESQKISHTREAVAVKIQEKESEKEKLQRTIKEQSLMIQKMKKEKSYIDLLEQQMQSRSEIEKIKNQIEQKENEFKQEKTGFLNQEKIELKKIQDHYELDLKYAETHFNKTTANIEQQFLELI